MERIGEREQRTMRFFRHGYESRLNLTSYGGQTPNVSKVCAVQGGI